MKSTTHIIRGARVLDSTRSEASFQDVLVKDGVIASIGAPGMEAPDDAAVVDASDRLLIPGLINAHSHGHGALAKGLGDRWTLELLLNAGPWINAGRLLEDKVISAQLNAAEMLLKGCTAVYDLYAEFPVPTADGIFAVAEAYNSVGIRAVVAPMIADLSLFEAIPGLVDALPEELRASVSRVRLAPADEIIEACRTILKHWKYDTDRVRPAIAPTIPLHCTDAFLKVASRLADEFGVGIHTHLGESRIQAVSGKKRYGKTLTAHLAELGLLNDRVTAAHCVWLDDEDISLLAGHGCSVAHNPGSNLRLGSGIAPVQRMLRTGVNVGLGTDGSHCSDHQNMFESMRLASFVSRVAERPVDDWVGTDQSLAMSTRGSAKALGFDGKIGRLEPGYFADIVFLDLNNINFVPLNNALNQLVHSEEGTAVVDVMVHGEFALRDRTFVKFDFSALRRKAEGSVERLRREAAVYQAFAERMAGYVSGFCLGSHNEFYHIDRLCGCHGRPAGFRAE